MTRRRCPQCTKPVENLDTFCPECGARLENVAQASARSSPAYLHCTKCNAEMKAEDAHCSECGHPQARKEPHGHTAASPSKAQNQTASRPTGATTASPHQNETNTTYQDPVFDGQSYHCPKCNAVLTSGLKRCGMCGVYFMQPVPLPISRPVSQTASRSQSRMWLLLPLCILLIIGATVLYAKWHTASGNLVGRYIWINPNRRDFYIVLQFDASGSYSVQRSFDPLVSRGTYTMRGKDITFTHHVAYDYYETFHGHRQGNTVFTGMMADEDKIGHQVFGNTEFAFVRQ
jgi:hypothetical protein